MVRQNTNVLYEPLYRKVTQENNQLRRKVKQLEEEVTTKDEELAKVKEELQKQEDTNKKLRTLLFKREKPHRSLRPTENKPRSLASYTRPKPKEQDITEHKVLTLDSCPDCGHDVSAPQSERTRIIEDIVFHPQPEVTEWTIQRHYCSDCHKLVEGSIPGVVPKTRIGPNTLTCVVLAKYRWNLPYNKIQDNLKLSYGLHISEGAIARLITRAATLMGPKWEEIIQAVQAGQTVHCDETGWYVNGQKVWAHTFATNTTVLYEIIDSRGKGVVTNALGDDFTGTRVTDCLPNYKNLPGSHQICWAHLTREATENQQRVSDNRERQQLAITLNSIYAQLRHRTKRWEETRAAALKGRLQQKVAKLQRQSWCDDTCQRLVKRLDDYQHALFTCLDQPGIPPDNNHAERTLRKLVIQRKISGGNRSPEHALHHAKIMSVLETLRLEENNLLEALESVLRQGMQTQLAGG
ncbi:hypothetical protein CL628_03135 [bacterium]|nr:hypothetical protein [bacterium]|tara:strand:+ start:714 stop:2108 length:1395 start_codon:yes stop_codon:yes gene_type:complete